MKANLLFITMLLCANYAQAQDPIFTQFYTNRMYLNPAMTGLEHGLTIAGTARTHWTMIPGQYNIAFASIDLQEPALRSGFGITAWQFSQGEAALTSQHIGLNYAYTILLKQTQSTNHNLHIGFRGAVATRFIDWSKLTFSDQIDPISGVVNSTNAVPLDKPTSFFDADAGIMWRSESNFLAKGTRSSLGVAVNHLTNNDESLLGRGARRPMRFTFHGGLEIPVNWIDGAGKKQIAWSPNLKVDIQEGLSVATFGIYGIYETLYFGVQYQERTLLFDPRNTNNVSFAVGYKAKINKTQSLLFGYSFDANMSGLSTRTGGSHEIALRYNINDIQLYRQGVNDKKGKRIMNCKAFF